MLNKINDFIKPIVAKFKPSLPTLGVELGKNSFKLSLLKKNSDHTATLLDYSIIELEEGKEYKDNEITALLEAAIKDMGVVQECNVNFIISGSEVDSKRIILPGMPKEDIVEALKWQAKDHFLLNTDESALDFEILKEKQTEDGNKNIELIANIASNKSVDEKVHFANDLFINKTIPSAIAPVAYGLLNLYQLADTKKSDSPIALIDIGLATTTIAIVKDQKMSLMRQLGVSGEDFTKALTGTLVSDAGRMELSLTEAENLKRNVGFPDETQREVKKGITALQVNSLMRPVLEKLANDIKRSLDYYASQFGEGKVTKIYLSGGSAKLKNITSQLFQRLSIPIEILKSPENLKLEFKNKDKSSFEDDFLKLVPSLGVALAAPNDVNLMPDNYRMEGVKRIEKVSARIIFMGVILFLAVFYIFNVAQEKTLNKVVSARRPEWEKLQEIQTLHSRIIQKNSIVNNTLKNQIPIYYLLKSLSTIIPGEIYLRNVRIENNATSIKIDGIAFEKGDIGEVILSKFIKSLEDSTLFHNVLLESSQDVTVSKKKALEFEISCNLGKF